MTSPLFGPSFLLASNTEATSPAARQAELEARGSEDSQASEARRADADNDPAVAAILGEAYYPGDDDDKIQHGSGPVVTSYLHAGSDDRSDDLRSI